MLYKDYAADPKHRTIRVQLVKELIGDYCSRRKAGRQGSLLRPLPLRHFPVKPSPSTARWINHTVAVPISYNEFMGGVDRGDQLRSYYSCRTKSRKFYKYIFYFLLDVAITNAFVLYKDYAADPKHRTIRVQLAKELIGDYCSRRKAGRQGSLLRPLPLRPFPVKPSPSLEDSSRRNRKRCVRCLEHGSAQTPPGTAKSVQYHFVTQAIQLVTASSCGIRTCTSVTVFIMLFYYIIIIFSKAVAFLYGNTFMQQLHVITFQKPVGFLDTSMRFRTLQASDSVLSKTPRWQRKPRYIMYVRFLRHRGRRLDSALPRSTLSLA